MRSWILAREQTVGREITPRRIACAASGGINGAVGRWKIKALRRDYGDLNIKQLLRYLIDKGYKRGKERPVVWVVVERAEVYEQRWDGSY
jgi:hypothetical protein